MVKQTFFSYTQMQFTALFSFFLGFHKIMLFDFVILLADCSQLDVS